MSDDLKPTADQVEPAADAEAPTVVLPEMTLVVSSNVHSVGHDGTALFVRFLDKEGKPDRTYRYPTAPKMTFDEMLKAESPGRFFRSEVSVKHKGERLP